MEVNTALKSIIQLWTDGVLLTVAAEVAYYLLKVKSIQACSLEITSTLVFGQFSPFLKDLGPSAHSLNLDQKMSIPKNYPGHAVEEQIGTIINAATLIISALQHQSLMMICDRLAVLEHDSLCIGGSNTCSI